MDLRKAVRAIEGLEPKVLQGITPKQMGKVLLARGWEPIGTRPVPSDHRLVAFTDYDNVKADGRSPSGIKLYVQIPMQTSFGDYASLVVCWARSVASRHGNLAPAEILAEVEIEDAI